MGEPVEWSPDGTPRSPRFADVYRSAAGGLAQARHVFLAGCGLPQAWQGQPQWRILETGFGLGLNFLAAWRAWKDDPQRPRMLHFASVEAWPVAAEDLLRSAADAPDLLPLAQQLAQRWWGLVPGVHRFSFEDGRVLLTLAVGDARAMLQQQDFAADAVFLDGFDPQRNPDMWALPLLQAVARCCRRGAAVATWSVAGQLRRDMQQCGFVVEKAPGLPPKREALRGRYDPHWSLRHEPPAGVPQAGTALVIGGGLAGAAAAASLGRRGWRVHVLDAAQQPAQGASGLPAGLLAPHTSPDDNLLSRLSRAGVRLTLQEAGRLLRQEVDWAPSGVREVQPGGARPLPDLGEAAQPWQHAEGDAIWHAAAAWIRPAALVQAWLAESGARWSGGTHVHRLRRTSGGWEALDARGAILGSADMVVACAALGTGALVEGLTLHAVRGQVSLGPAGDLGPEPARPLNGNGHLLPNVPFADGPRWLCGSTYVRGDLSLEERAAEHQANFERLQVLSPEAAVRLRPAFQAGAVQAWTGVRCASTDRRPLVGELQPGLWVSTAMGSRGLTFAALAAELLAARLHAEPLPLPSRLAAALDAGRQAPATRA